MWSEAVLHVPPNLCSTFSGNVEHVTYFNQETGQCVFKFKTELYQQAISISCRRAWLYPGMGIEIDADDIQMENGLWRARNIKIHVPKTERALRKFLKSQAIAGVGPKLSKILAKAFPTDFFDVLEKSPELLLDITGVGKKKQQQILNGWRQFKSKTEFRSFLFLQNFPLTWADLLWPGHGETSLEYLKNHPYEAVSAYHLDFEKIDKFVLNQDGALDSLERLRSGLNNILWEFFKEGHCAYPEDEVIALAVKKLEVPKERLEEVLEMEIISGNIVCDSIRSTECLYLKENWLLEKDVAKKLLKFHLKETPWGWLNSRKVLDWAQDILSIELADLQKEAIETALSSSLTVITGGPGTGKTTLIRSLVTILQTQSSQFALCCPTGRAAQRLKEATNMPAQTIHRLLKYDGLDKNFFYNKENPLNVDLVLVDEASMLDLALFNHLLDALPPDCSLILVGDVDQIPSVGAGNILYSLIVSPLFKLVRLTQIYRQSAHSAIKQNAQKINEGKMPTPHQGGDFQYIPVHGIKEIQEVLNELLNKKLMKANDDIRASMDLQILVPLNQGPLGTQLLNEVLQEKINKKAILSSRHSTIDFGQELRVGDKVMVIKNDYKKEVFNGDIGFVDFVQYDEYFLEVQFNGRRVRFEFNELDRLSLAYAISIHKAQGSEYKTVIVILTEDHLPMAQRHLIYTAITRGKENVYLIAEPMALQKTLNKVDRRWEKLTELLSFK